MKIKKNFNSVQFKNKKEYNEFKQFISGLNIKIPKKSKGFTSCLVCVNGFIITTYTFCSMKDKWDFHLGRKITSERMNEILKKLKVEI